MLWMAVQSHKAVRREESLCFNPPAVTVLKFLIIYKQGTSHLHVALGFKNEVAALGWAFLRLFYYGMYFLPGRSVFS